MVEKDIKTLFNFVKEKTRNFSNIRSDLLLNSSRFILIFRLILCEKRATFAKRFDVTDSNIANLESGRQVIKTIQTSKRYCSVLHELIKNVEFRKNANLETTLNNFCKLKDLDSKGHLVNTYEDRRIAAKSGLIAVSKQKLNDLESEIAKYLLQMDLNEYKYHPEKYPFTFDSHKNVEIKNKTYNVDFILPNVSNPLIIIEATSITSKVYQTNQMKGSRINSRFANLKFSYPNINFFAVVKSKIGIVPMSFSEEIMYGKVINIEKINEFLSEIKNKLAAVVQPG